MPNMKKSTTSVKTQNFRSPKKPTDSCHSDEAEERIKTGTCLGVPQFAIPVVGTTEELLAIIVELYVSHCLFVTKVSPHTPPVVVNFPNLKTDNNTTFHIFMQDYKTKSKPCTMWWWLFPHWQEFGENVQPFIPCLRFFFPLNWRLACAR